MVDYRKSDIAGVEFKNATFVKSNTGTNDDLIVIKETIHLKNGETRPNLRFIKNYERPFYISLDSTKKHHTQKRVWEKLENLREYRCRQGQLTSEIQKKLRMRGGLKMLNRSPYLYGTDISSTTLIKKEYMTRYSQFKSNYRVAHLDCEFDIVDGTDSITILSVSCGNKVYQALTKQFIGTTIDFVEKVKKLYDEEINPILSAVDSRIEQFKGKEHDFELIIEEVEDEYEAVKWIFSQLHNVIKPDILSIWNLPYDLGKMTQALRRRGCLPEEVFCDPSIPDDFRFFEFTEGRAKIEDANGKAESKDPCDRWHKVVCPSGFFWADQMSVRRAVRKHLNKEPSYSLGDVLYREIGFGKLKKDKTVRSTGVSWHIHMQRHERVYYSVYNMFDNIGAQLLDEKTKDLCATFPAQCGYSDLQSYGSQGRKLADDFYFDLLDRGYVITGVSDEMEKEWDKYLVPLDGWISTLSPHLIDERMGSPILQERPGIFSSIVKWVLDIDVKSSYPSTGVWMNISQETTKRAMARIVGVTMEEQRRAGLNLCSGRVNAVDIMVNICNAPTQLQLLHRFKAREGIE